MSNSRPADRDSLEGFLRDLSVRLTRLERHSHPHPAATKQVSIGSEEPTDANVQLWFDPDAILPTEVSRMTGVLYARVADQWVAVTSPSAAPVEGEQ